MAIFKTFLHTGGGELMSKWQVRKLKKKTFAKFCDCSTIWI